MTKIVRLRQILLWQKRAVNTSFIKLIVTLSRIGLSRFGTKKISNPLRFRPFRPLEMKTKWPDLVEAHWVPIGCGAGKGNVNVCVWASICELWGISGI